MAKIIDYLQEAQSTIFSFEILPPRKGMGIQGLFDDISPLMEVGPKFINVTYHREEVINRKSPDGKDKKLSVRRRPGTVGICAAIMNKFHVETVPHIICGGFTREETEGALIDLDFLGIQNLMILRGDAIKSEKRFFHTPGGHRHASELLQQVMNLNDGIYLEGDIEKPAPTKFCCGVAGYPEKHFEAPSMESDLKYLKLKIDLGADYIVTQMFFDNQKYFDFVDFCHQSGIKVPIIPGLKPLTNLKQLTILPELFHTGIPDALAKEMKKAKSDSDVKAIGTEWCIEQAKELAKAKVPCLHFYSMGKSDPILEIAKSIF